MSRVRDARGFLRIVDRTKDMIVTGGFNVYPREVEDVIGDASRGRRGRGDRRADEKWGEAVTALVVAEAGGASAEALMRS